MATALLSAQRDAGGGLVLVALDVAPELAGAYTSPGQYVEVSTPSGRGYFVLASRVGERPWELLVKNAGGAASALVSLPLGSTVETSEPMGAGFDVALSTQRPIMIAVAGSAIGVARPVIAARIAGGVADSTFLFLGLRATTDLPIPSEVTAWSEQGVNIVLCLSRSELDHHPEILPRARRAGCYVQDAIARALEADEVPPGLVAIVAGPNAMLAAIRSLARTQVAANPGALPIEIVTNF
jgi:NAD(P)H-flavin reductase